MAQLLETTVQGPLRLNNYPLCLIAGDATCVLRRGASSTLTLGSTLKNIITNESTVSLIGGTATSSSGINLGDEVILWSPNGIVRGFNGGTGSEIFRIDGDGRFLCLKSNDDASNGLNYKKVSYKIAKASVANAYTSVAFENANHGATLNKATHSVSDDNVTVKEAGYAIAPFSNGLVMISGTWIASDRSKLKDDTWFEINLPESFYIYGGSITDLDFNAGGVGNGWFFASDTFTDTKTGEKRAVRSFHVCKDTGNAGTNGFTWMIIAKLADQSKLPGLFN